MFKLFQKNGMGPATRSHKTIWIPKQDWQDLRRREMPSIKATQFVYVCVILLFCMDKFTHYDAIVLDMEKNNQHTHFAFAFSLSLSISLTFSTISFVFHCETGCWRKLLISLFHTNKNAYWILRPPFSTFISPYLSNKRDVFSFIRALLTLYALGEYRFWCAFSWLVKWSFLSKRDKT